MDKFVSIIVPVRNERANIEECIISLLNQDYPKEKYEIIIVNGHSRDGTLEVLSKLPVKVIEDGGRGASEARNRGVAYARGEIVAFTDGDCVAQPDWIKNLAGSFDGPDVGGVGGALRTGNLGTLLSLCENLNTCATYKGFITANMAYRVDVINKAGGFDPNIKCGEDWDLWWRVLDWGYKVRFESSAVVVHFPPENRGWLPYYRKEFWYARMDVKVFVKRVRLILANKCQDRRFKVRARPTFFFARQAIIHASTVSLILASLLISQLLYLGLGLLALWTVYRTLLVTSFFPQENHGRRKLALMVFAGYISMKAIVRGFGTLVGLVELVRRLPLLIRNAMQRKGRRYSNL